MDAPSTLASNACPEVFKSRLYGVWNNLSRGRCPWLWQGSETRLSFRSLSNINYSVIFCLTQYFHIHSCFIIRCLFWFHMLMKSCILLSLTYQLTSVSLIRPLLLSDSASQFLIPSFTWLTISFTYLRLFVLFLQFQFSLALPTSPGCSWQQSEEEMQDTSRPKSLWLHSSEEAALQCSSRHQLPIPSLWRETASR